LHKVLPSARVNGARTRVANTSMDVAIILLAGRLRRLWLNVAQTTIVRCYAIRVVRLEVRFKPIQYQKLHGFSPFLHDFGFV